MNNDLIVSVGTIIQNDTEVLENFIDETSTILANSNYNYEIVLVDNCSTDDSQAEIKKLQRKFKNIRLIVLSKQYDEEQAKTAILDNCIGDFVVLMDINSDPPKLILNLVEKALNGYDLVIGERNNRKDDSFLQRNWAGVFYKISEKLTGYCINPNYSDYICMSRKMVNSLVQIRDRSRYLKYLMLEVGYKHTTVKFDKIQRTNNRKKRSFLDTFGFAFEILITNSDKLLRWSSLVGFSISLLNLFYMFYIFFIALFKEDVAAGWVSSSLVNSTMFFFLFLLLSIVSVYISSVLKETKKGSLYYISEETTSSVIYKEIDKKNIV
jgi:dolichol-phosphate mannosyltransferase